MNDSAPVKSLQSWATRLLLLAGVALCGCPDAAPGTGSSPSLSPPAAVLESVNLSDPIRPTADSQPIHLRAARNEWTSFVVQVSSVFANRPMSLRIGAPQSQSGTAIPAANLQVYQILSMPVDLNPGYVRHTGLTSANRSVPRALLAAPLENDSTLRLGALRDPSDPTHPLAHPNGGTILLWIDLYVPTYAPAGDYLAQCELLDSHGGPVGAPLPLRLSVYDFSLPEARHLQMVGELDWDRLVALYPREFGDAITPGLINRADPRFRRAVSVLDQMMLMGEQRRLALVAPGLRPTVKWPAVGPPQIDWREFDSLVGPWMRGNAFPDGVPVRYWPLPPAAQLSRYDARSRLTYWSAAAGHFDQYGWLDRSPVWMRGEPGALPASTAGPLCSEAAQILAAHAKVRVALPLSDDQLTREPALSSPENRDRLITTGAPLVSIAASSAAEGSHSHWLQTDLPGLVPYAGAGADERDVRVWAWLAFLRHAELIMWGHALPSQESASGPADPNALTWFYPGQWFGVAGPVPTIQLEWLRRAQQDYEYLWLASQRGGSEAAMRMARQLARPLELRPGQAADPVYALLGGTTSQPAWDRAQELLAEAILLREPGKPSDPARQRALYIETLQWAQPQERPQLVPRRAEWILNAPRKDPRGRSTGNWLGLRLGLDVFNASDAVTEKNVLEWGSAAAGSGWELHPQPSEIARLPAYGVQPATLGAWFNLDKITPDSSRPIELRLVNGFTRMPYRMRVRLPVATSDRRDAPIALDGRLDDWTDSDALQDGPLVLMMSRPDLQDQELRFAPGSATVYSAWSADHFYLGFSLDGLPPDERQAHNDVYYQARRAWGEDLCEVLIQPVYQDNALGPVLHVVCKPNGAEWVERKQPAKQVGEDWRTMEGTGVRYGTTTTEEGRWRGEVGIPWTLINSPGNGFPVLLRFNFAQHRHQTCETASWCGPVDFGRDEALMGALYLRATPEHPPDRPPAGPR